MILLSLSFSAYPSNAYIVHQNPDSIPESPPYDADQQLAMSLQEMFGSLDSFVAHVNASDFPASRRDIRIFTLAHGNFTGVYQRANLVGSDMEAIAARLENMDQDLWDAVNSSEVNGDELQQFEASMSAHDLKNATQLAARMQLSYRNVSATITTLNANSTGILKMLDKSRVDTTDLENGITGLNSYTERVNESNRKSSGLLGNARLTITASSREASSGEWIALSAALAVSNGTPAGRLIRFYVDDRMVGSAVTDSSGLGALVFPVDDRSFRNVMRAHAELDTRGDSLSPAVSNVAEITRRPEQAFLQTHVTPGSAAYGDTIYVYGTLAAASGMPAANQPVIISLAGAPAGNATTGTDGSYSLLLPILHDTPAGACFIQSSYRRAPDSALMSAVSPPAVVVVSPLASSVTLDPPGSVYRGGERATFNGTLTAGDGRPVAGANVSVFAGDELIGVRATGTDGHYSLDTAIPYNISPGDHAVYASFYPGEGRALAGSQSGAFAVSFLPLVPQISVRGLPWIAFPGDELSLTGIAMTDDGRPLDGRQISVNVSGATIGTATTGPGGGYLIAGKIASGPGICTLSIGVQGDGLLSGTDQGAGMILIMPFNRTATAVAVIVAMLVAGLLALRITSAGRLARRSKSPLPGPAAAPTAVQEPGPGVAAFDPEEELKALHGSISGGSDRREAIQSIYLAARRMLLDRDPALPGSATHRELYHRLTDSRPSLSEPLAVITNSYEDAVFGHFPPTDEEINSSLYSLNEMKRLLYGDGGIGQ